MVLRIQTLGSRGKLMEVLIKQTQEFMLKLSARSTWRLEKRKEIKGEITVR